MANPVATPATLEAYYAPYGDQHAKTTEGDLVKLHETAKSWRRKFGATDRPMFLDIGAHCGDTMLAMQAEGFVAHGIELSKTGVEHARSKGLNNIINMPIESAYVTPASMDLIHCWHVLEHLVDPLVALQRMFTWLRPGGILNLGLPHIPPTAHLLTAIKGTMGLGDGHILGFSASVLSELSLRCGFVIEQHIVYDSMPSGTLSRAKLRHYLFHIGAARFVAHYQKMHLRRPNISIIQKP